MRGGITVKIETVWETDKCKYMAARIQNSVTTWCCGLGHM